MKVICFLIAFCVLCPLPLSGQRVYDTLWTKTYGGVDLDKGSSIALTYDGGYIVAGETKNFGPGPLAIYLLRTDSLGDTLWTQAYGGSAYDYALSVKETADSGYIIAGVTTSFGAGLRDLYLIKTDSNGDTAWTRTLGGSDNDVGAAVFQTADGGYIITGTSYSYSAGSGDVWLVKTDASGGFVWGQNYGGADSDAGWDVQPTSDGGYIITGQTRSFGAGDFDVYLLKTNAFGDTVWTRTYGGTADDRGYSVCEYLDGYLIVGYTASFGAGNDDIYLIRADSLGDTLWTETYGGALDERAKSICEVLFGAYIIVGYTASYGAGGTDLYVLEINPYNGNIYWSGVYGGFADEEGSSVQFQPTGGYEQYFIVTGYTESFGAGIEDAWLLKFRWMDGIRETTVKPAKLEYHIPTVLSGPLHLPEDKPFKLYDITGREVTTTSLAPGIYFVEIDGKFTQKVVKVR
ncbi:hypothetical protein KAS45_03535 [candidate division WOR-3 bacterium]|nr:hypothetical protein [candidate division WOR-3 bacterium]MCK5560067.1 hypothetical protein [Thermoplasmata archaeon]